MFCTCDRLFAPASHKIQYNSLDIADMKICIYFPSVSYAIGIANAASCIDAHKM